MKEAQSKNLYVNTDFVENIENIKTDANVLVESGVYSQKELDAKYEICK